MKPEVTERGLRERIERGLRMVTVPFPHLAGLAAATRVSIDERLPVSMSNLPAMPSISPSTCGMCSLNLNGTRTPLPAYLNDAGSSSVNWLAS